MGLALQGSLATVTRRISVWSSSLVADPFARQVAIDSFFISEINSVGPYEVEENWQDL